MKSPDRSRFLITTRADLAARHRDAVDVLLVTGDAYVDHPSFGTPLLGRWLEANGFSVGIIAQPRWDSPEDILRLGRPRLFCGVSAGALDSMLAHYTAFRKKRSDDAYTPGGRAGARPNRAALVYANLVRQAFPGLPVILGGIEASLRRFVHYDFWTDALRRSLLLDAKADAIVYGMGERALLDIARACDGGHALAGIPGIVRLLPKQESPSTDCRELPSFEAIQETPRLLIDAARMAEGQIQAGTHALVQTCDTRRILCERPAEPLSTSELDRLYDLPFTYAAHPDYHDPIPSVTMIRDSITAVRGCGGGCSFCALALHQGRRVRSRSAEAICREVERKRGHPGWDGTISDIGGPTANAWNSQCTADPEQCLRQSCYAPEICPALKLDQQGYLDLLRRVRNLPGVRHVRVASGIRHDLAARDPEFVRGLVSEFTGGQLKLAPEHAVDHVLSLMRKGRFETFERFCTDFYAIGKAAGRELYVIPYVMSAFPGCTMDDMQSLSDWFSSRGWRLQQVQCFIPTPGTVASAMYFAGCDPDGNPIHVARSDAERLRQHHLLLGPGAMTEESAPPANARPPHAGSQSAGRRRGPRRS